VILIDCLETKVIQPLNEPSPPGRHSEQCHLLLRIVDRLVDSSNNSTAEILHWLAETLLAALETENISGLSVDFAEHHAEAGSFDSSQTIASFSPRSGNSTTRLSLSGSGKKKIMEDTRECLQTIVDTVALSLQHHGNDNTASELKRSEARIAAYRSLLQKLASELSLAEARERRNIAEDLHDHVGQALAFVRTRLARLQGNSVFHGFEEDFSESLRLIDQTIAYIRNLTVTISPPVLYELGLAPAIEWLVEQAEHKYDLKATLTIRGDFSSLGEDLRVILFKTIQELLNNIGKHAAARRFELSAAYTRSGLEIKLCDDGRGFDTSILERRVAQNEGFGLFSIRERIQYIGGLLQIESQPGHGTTVTITAPRWTKD